MRAFILLLVLVASVIGVLSIGGRSSPRRPSDLLQRNAAAVREALTESGTLVEVSGPTSVTLTLPRDAAMKTTKREAREIALMAHSRLGDGVIVRVKTPAGQTLATAGP